MASQWVQQLAKFVTVEPATQIWFSHLQLIFLVTWWLCSIVKVQSSFHTLHDLLFSFKTVLVCFMYMQHSFLTNRFILLLLFSLQIRGLLYQELFTFSLSLHFWSAGEHKFIKYKKPTLNRKKCKKKKKPDWGK